MNTSLSVDFQSIAGELLTQSLSLLKQWFPHGRLYGREYKIGNLRGDPGESLSINIDTGKWSDFAEGIVGGDLISLYAAIHNLSQLQAAKQFSGAAEIKLPDIFITGQSCHPIPHHKHGNPVDVYEYRNYEGVLYGYVCRFQPLNSSKEFAPLTCWKTPGDKLVWKWKKWTCHSLPYRAEEIRKEKDKPILIVEGERKADHAQKLLPSWLVIGWCGGAGALSKTDWSALKYRYCWIWPDNDAPGIKAAHQLKKILPDLHIVKDLGSFPQGWDLGDAEPAFDPLNYLIDKTKNSVVLHAPAERTQLIFPQSDLRNKPLATLANMRALLNYQGIICRYNVISKRNKHFIPNESFSIENEEESALACIYSFMKEAQLPVDGHKLYLMRIADENQYNPVLDWVRSKPWDGKYRLQELCDTIESPEKEAKDLLIRRWLLTAMHMAAGQGIDGAGCLVLQGPQDLGKTWWARKLVSEELRKELIRTDATVDPHDKDSVSQVISYWICELGEIGATFVKSELQALKAFITRDNDIMRRPYGEGDKRYPRRTALIASVDQKIYLHDTAGNRRFWTIPCTKINSYHEIDMQQLWAEILDMIETFGEDWKLTHQEKEHIKRINKESMQIEPIHEMIMNRYEIDGIYNGQWKSATHIASELGFKTATQRETRIISSFMKEINVETRKSKGFTQYKLVDASKPAEY